MSETAENLPDDPAVLKAMIAELQAENAKITATLRVHDQLVQALRLRIAKLQKLAFGKSSEKIEREIAQLELALEDLLVAVAEDDDAMIDEGHDEPIPEAADAPALRRRPHVSDETLRERRELDPGSCCPDCGGDLRVVGEDVSELLDMIAAQMKVIQIARIKKSCRRCEKMVQEPAPSRPIPGSMAGPNLLAHVLVSKFDDHLPLYRQHEIFARMGADIPETTLVGWCGRAMKTLSPLIERDINGQPADVRHAARQKLSKPKVTAFFAWSEQQHLHIPGKSDLAKAFRYGLSRQNAFSLFLSDGRVAIDNNPAERALRPIPSGWSLSTPFLSG